MGCPSLLYTEDSSPLTGCLSPSHARAYSSSFTSYPPLLHSIKITPSGPECHQVYSEKQVETWLINRVTRRVTPRHRPLRHLTLESNKTGKLLTSNKPGFPKIPGVRAWLLTI